MFQSLLEFDRYIFLLINKGSKNPVFDWFMPVISEWRFFWLPLGLFLVFLLFRGAPRTRWMLVGLIAAFALGDSITTHVIKPLVARPRPYSTMMDIFVFKGHWGLSQAVEPHQTISFPSTHAVNATAAAAILIYHFRQWWPLIAGGAGLICYSRVYMGLHYPSDVLAGIVVGLSCAGLILACAAWLTKRFPDRFPWLAKEART